MRIAWGKRRGVEGMRRALRGKATGISRVSNHADAASWQLSRSGPEFCSAHMPPEFHPE